MRRNRCEKFVYDKADGRRGYKGGFIIQKDRIGHLVGQAMRTIPKEGFELIREITKNEK